MPNTQIDPILSPLQRTVTRNLLKHAAGRAIFCPSCQTIMDWKRTVIYDVQRQDTPDSTVKVFVWCGKCADKALPSLQKACLDRNLVLEITDGRKFK